MHEQQDKQGQGVIAVYFLVFHVLSVLLSRQKSQERLLTNVWTGASTSAALARCMYNPCSCSWGVWLITHFGLTSPVANLLANQFDEDLVTHSCSNKLHALRR